MTDAVSRMSTTATANGMTIARIGERLHSAMLAETFGLLRSAHSPTVGRVSPPAAAPTRYGVMKKPV